MRTQKRNFVVEIKSSRRRLRPESKSIWGDTDFKALSREAEAAHFLMNAPVAAPSEQLGSDSSEIEVKAAAAIEANDIAVDLASPLEANYHAPAAASTDVTQIFEPVVKTTSPKKSRSEVASKPRARRGSGKSVQSMVIDEDLVSAEQLRSLQEENDRLTRLLAQQLKMQNRQLRDMLKRFD